MRRVYAFLASKRFAVFNFLLLTISLVIIRLFEIKTLAPVSIALFLLFVNLLFCFIKNRGFKRRTMTVFHLFLLLFLLSSAYGSLFFFFGFLELAEGQMEMKGYQRYVKGILHRNELDDLAIYQDKIIARFYDDYVTDLNSLIRVHQRDNGAKKEREFRISYLSPFEWKGYSFYLHRDRGYAAYLRYKKDGRIKEGFVDFPDYAHFYNHQKNDFVIPEEGMRFVAELFIKDNIRGKGKWELRYPEDVSLKIERGAEVYYLKPGERVKLKDDGSLEFLDVRRWTDYVIYYNPVGKLLGVFGIGAFVSLLIHYTPGFIRGLGYSKIKNND